MTSNDLAVLRLVKALGDFESLRVDDVLLSAAGRFEIVVHDDRLDASYRIASHSDYWDFLSHFSERGEWAAGRIDAGVLRSA